MKTIRRMIYGEVLIAIAFVAMGFLALFFFFDLVDELQYLGRNNAVLGGLTLASDVYQIRQALVYVALLVPNHLYELLPISVLIGTIFVMARMAQSSEYTILRTSGLTPWRALIMLLNLGAFFVLISFVIGEYVSPLTERNAQLLKARYMGSISVGQTGAWLKEKQVYNSVIANVRTLSPANEMLGLQILEFNNAGLMVSKMQAASASFGLDDAWQLHNVTRTEFNVAASPDNAGKLAAQTASVTKSTVAKFRWPTEITQQMVSVALLKPERMGTLDLFNYIRHLDDNGQAAQRYEIEFWKKIFYPLSCLVMVMLALPFAYLHFRSGGIAAYVFAGVMIGISFFLLNNVFGYVGNLQNWEPWLAAAAPGMLYMALSLSAFGWLVLRR